jgi:hypothetical protein
MNLKIIKVQQLIIIKNKVSGRGKINQKSENICMWWKYKK